MEDFAAQGARPPLEECLERVSQCDLLLVLVAHRYGWVPEHRLNPDGKSIVWLECEQAIAAGKEVIAFLVDDSCDWPPEKWEMHRLESEMIQGRSTPDLYEDVNRSMDGLRKLREWLNARGVRSTFDSPAALKDAVRHALGQWRQRISELASSKAKPELKTAPQKADPTAYLNWLYDETSKIDIRGLQVGNERAHSFPIEDLYIGLTMADAEREKAGEGIDELRGDRSIPLEKALSNRTLAVIGEPGSGKSTFLRRIAALLSRGQLDGDEAASRRLGLAGNPLPVFIRLSELADFVQSNRGERTFPTRANAAVWLPRFLAQTNEEENWGLDVGFFRNRLESGGCLLLLDGLDEAPNQEARKTLSSLIEGIARAYRGCSIAATSRPDGFPGLGDFKLVHIQPLNEEAVGTFLKRWSQAIHADRPRQAERHFQDLKSCWQGLGGIRKMARTPVMLTALAVLHWNERRLPEQRAELYESILKWLAHSRERRLGRPSADRILELLQELALAMHDHSEGRQTQLSFRQAAECLAPFWEEGSVARVERLLEEEVVDSGILTRRGNLLRFRHLTFQEYLAARALAGRTERDQARLLWGRERRVYSAEWRETALLLSGVLFQQGRPKLESLLESALEDLGQDPSLVLRAQSLGLLGAMERDLSPGGYRFPEDKIRPLRVSVSGIFEKGPSRSVPAAVRIDAAEALGWEDPRLKSRDSERWVSILEATFLMGAQKDDPEGPNYDEQADDDESPVHEVRLSAYRIARYPVTVAEYRGFVESRGYDEKTHWKEGGGWKQFDQPGNWSEQLKHPNRPVTGVSWYEAMAFAAWSGCRLPTEAEWEFAARGPQARRYPWGNEAADTERLNCTGNIGCATPVGIYPQGETPEGISDLAGNVWEWCTDGYEKDYYKRSSTENPLNNNRKKSRVLRGGSWFTDAINCRAAYRYYFHPECRGGSIGLRLVEL